MFKRATGMLVLMGLVLLAVGCSDSKTPAAVAANAGPASPAPTSAAGAPEQPLTVSAPLVVENQVDVGAQREGVVAKVLAEPGAHVKAGQVLAMLDDRQVSADLEAARAKSRSIDADLKNWKAKAEVLQSDYARAQKMWEAGLITQEQLEHAKYQAESDQWYVKSVGEMLLNSQASERSLELEAEKTRIRAPFTGLVARRYIRVGQKVALGDRMFWVTAEGPLRVRFTLPARFLGQIQKGQQIPLTAADFSTDERSAKVIEISPVVDPASGTIEILAELTGKAGDLRPGMTVNLRVGNP
jgi:RND family efflux transporter MFP subunit